MRRTFVFVAFLFGFAGVAGVAHAEVVQYMSRHPIPKRIGHGFCDIDVPHFHDYPPSDPRLYRQVDGQYYFVGDPTPFGYDGPRYSFYGPHPIADASVQLGGPSYCYLQGPHSHWYAPPPQAHFEMKGGAYWYTGAFEPAFYARPTALRRRQRRLRAAGLRTAGDRRGDRAADLPRRIPRRGRAGVALRAGLARESRLARAGTGPRVARAGTGPRMARPRTARDGHARAPRGVPPRGATSRVGARARPRLARRPAGTRTGRPARRLARRPSGTRAGRATWRLAPRPRSGGARRPARERRRLARRRWRSARTRGGGHGNQFHR